MRKRSVVTTGLCVVALVSLLTGAGGVAARTTTKTYEMTITHLTGRHPGLDGPIGVGPEFNGSGPVAPFSLPMAMDALPDRSSTSAGTLDARWFAGGIIAIAVGLIGLLLRRLAVDQW